MEVDEYLAGFGRNRSVADDVFTLKPVISGTDIHTFYRNL